MGLDIVYETDTAGKTVSDVVDIVTVHGLYESAEATWKEQASGILWLKDLLDAPARRVLNFGFTAGPSSLLVDDPANNILQNAHTLVAELEAIRNITETPERPLLFLCHGLGGILVKKALAFSATQVSKKVEHKYSIYISTYAIVFFATPHFGFTPTVWQSISQETSSPSKQHSDLPLMISRFDETLQTVADEFSPLVKQFNIYFFWESKRSQLGDVTDYVVSQESAAPTWDRTERCGIQATHSLMCKFDNELSPGYTTVKAALKRYGSDCHSVIRLRWNIARRFLETQRSIEATELVGFDVHQSNKPFTYLNSPKFERKQSFVENKYYYVPHNVSSIYTGWDSVTKQIQQSLLTPQSPVFHRQRRIFVLYGLGGSGKTQFCLKFVHDNRASFWAVFWLDASRTENAERALSQIGRLGGLGDNHQAGIYWLTGLSLPWLLVVDNADDPATDYSKYFPDGERGHIIVTSRLQACKIHATVGSHEFREMNEEDAIALLLKASGLGEAASSKDRSSAQAIAKTLGYLPLALTQAGASIRQEICSLQEYLDTYNLHKTEMLKQHFVQGTDQYEHTVYTTWEISVQRIQKSGTIAAADAIDLLQTMAFLHFQQICMDLFIFAWINLRKTYENQQNQSTNRSNALNNVIGSILPQYIFHFWSRREEIPSYPSIVSSQHKAWDTLRFRRALAILVEHSLIYKDLDRQTYSMHPIVHLWSRERMSEDQQRVWSDLAINTLAASFTPTANATNREYRRSMIPHIDACIQHQHRSASFIRHENSNTLAIALKFSNIYSENGEWQKAEMLRKRVIVVRQRVLGLEHPDTLDVMFELADGYWNLFRVAEALQVYQSIAKHSQNAYGDKDRRRLKAIDNLAKTLWLAGKTDEAQKWSEIATREMTAVLGEGHPDTLTAMLNLARNYMHKGRSREAAEMLEFVLDQRRRLYGDGHLDTLAAYAELGITYHALRELDKAEELVDRVLHERSRILGSNHAYTLWAVNDLAKIYTDQGRPREAEGLLTGILDIVIRTLGSDHIGMLMTKYNLARAYSGQEKWEESKTTLIELASIQEQKLPPQHPDRLAVRLERARTERHLGNLTEAEETLVAVIEDMSNAKGHNHPQTRKAMGQLSAIYIDTGRLDEAEKLDQRLGSSGT